MSTADIAWLVATRLVQVVAVVVLVYAVLILALDGAHDFDHLDDEGVW